MIEKFQQYCKASYRFVRESAFSVYELLLKVIEKLNEVIDFVNDFQSQLDQKEDSVNITNNRKLSETGDFTGTLCNGSKTACEVVDGIDTIEDIAKKLDDKVSLEFIIDGGTFPFTDPPVHEIDGGVV